MTINRQNRETRPGLYAAIFANFLDRTIAPSRSPSYVIYFLLAIVGLGAMGIWMEIYIYVLPDSPTSARIALNEATRTLAICQGHLESQQLAGIRTALLTFFPAWAGTAGMQLIWASEDKHVRSAAFLLFAIFPLIALLIFPSRVKDIIAISFGCAASILALWVWWVANAKQVEFLDTIAIDASTGGPNPTGPLPGGLDGFQV